MRCGVRGPSVDIHCFRPSLLIVSHETDPKLTRQRQGGNFSSTKSPNRRHVCDGLKIGKPHILGRKALIALEAFTELSLQLQLPVVRVGALTFESLISNIVGDNKPPLFAKGGRGQSG